MPSFLGRMHNGPRSGQKTDQCGLPCQKKDLLISVKSIEKWISVLYHVPLKSVTILSEHDGKNINIGRCEGNCIGALQSFQKVLIIKKYNKKN